MSDGFSLIIVDQIINARIKSLILKAGVEVTKGEVIL